MPQFVGADRDRDAGETQITSHDQPNGTRGNSSPRFVNEEWAAMYFRRCAVTLDCLERRQTYRANAFLPAFSENADRLGVKIYIRDLTCGQFDQAQTAHVIQFLQRCVEQAHNG